MCGHSAGATAPLVGIHATIEMELGTGHWFGHLWAEQIDAEHQPHRTWSVGRDFGPFDTPGDVLQWFYREASALVRVTAALATAAQVPPQGNDESPPQVGRALDDVGDPGSGSYR